MAPPRQQRTATVADDSRSEASSGPREPKTTTSKGRKGANGTNSSSRADGRASAAVNAATANVTSAPAQQQPPEELPNIPWSDMPLDILHSYRHAYNLPIPSAYSKTYSHILLSQGIGLRSPTSIAVQRSQILAQHPHAHPQPASSSSSSATANGIIHRSHNRNRNHSSRKHNNASPYNEKDTLNRIIGQSRVSKEHLALAVRKHFNSAGLAEQETIARFLYKVREEGKGRQFRLRFQP